MDVMKRLEMAMNHGLYNRSTLSLDLNMSRQAVQNWFSPKVVTQPKIKSLKQIATLCRVNEDWLIYGEGPMTGKDATKEELMVRKVVLATEIERLKKINAVLEKENTSILNTFGRIGDLIGTLKS